MALIPMTRVLLTLRFYALVTMLISVADVFGVSIISSASRTIKNVSYATIAGSTGSFLNVPITVILLKQKLKCSRLLDFH